MGRCKASHGRMVKWKGRVASIAPVLASVSALALYAGDARAEVVISGHQGTQEYVTVDEDILVTETGDLHLVGGSDLAAIYVDVADYTSDMTINGEVTLHLDEQSSAAAISFANDLSGNLVNTGTITALMTGSDTDLTISGVAVYGDLFGTINNSGTIDAQALSDSSDASAAGIYIAGNVGKNARIDNSGEISVFAQAADEYNAYAYGVQIDGTLRGVVANSGTIDVNAVSSTDYATAYGIYVGGDVGSDGLIENTGTISAVAQTDSSSDAVSYGIYVSETVNGTIDNQGTIESRATAGSTYATAYGVYIGSDLDGTVVNSGKIIVKASTSDSESATGYGVYVSGNVSGAIDNQGLIDVEASAGTDYAYAYGIHVGTLDVGGAISNSGTIKVKASTVTDSTAYAYGIYVAGDASGTITNSGLIDALAQSGTYSATAYGIYVGDYLYGTIRNTDTGTIKVDTVASESSPDAYGIYVGRDIVAGGLIENAGLIDVGSESIYSEPTAHGIYISGDMDGTIRNLSTGVISAHSEAHSSDAQAYGLYLNGDVDGLIDNQGVIESTARSTDSEANVWGIYVNTSLHGDILNSGRISALGVATDNGSNDNVTVYGIHIGDGVTGLLENTGTIEATVSADEYYGSAYGIYVGSGGISPDGRVSNSGKIIAESTVPYSYAYAEGIWVSGNVAGVLENLDSGEITVTATSDSSVAQAWGMYANSLSSEGRVTNAGTVTVSAYGNMEQTAAQAFGIEVNRVDTGRVENSGTIEVLADVGSGYAKAYGMALNITEESGVIVNSGSIHADAWSTDDSADAYGVYLTSFNGTFTNTGAITAHEEGGLGDAISASGDTGLLRLVTKGWIEGYIVPTGNVDVDVIGAKGGSIHWTVDDSDNGGSYTVNDTGYNGVPVAVRYNEGSVEFATFDASGLAALRQGAADAGFVGADVVAGQASAAAVAGAPQATRGPVGSGGFTPFVSGSFKSATYGGDSVTLDQDVDTTAGVVGGTFASDSGLAFGLAVGALRSEADVTGPYGTSSETSSTGGIASVGVAGTSGALRFAAAISAGQLSHDTLRYTNNNLAEDGLQTNDASYDSDFVAAQLGLSGRFELASGMTLVPMTALRYARHSVDGYVEGGPDGAEVDAQSFGVFEGEVGLGVEKAMGAGVVSGGLSYVSRSINGDETTAVGLIGDTIGVPTDLGVGSFAKLSIGYTSDFGAATQMRVGAETLFSSDGFAGGKVTGEIRFSF